MKGILLECGFIWKERFSTSTGSASMWNSLDCWDTVAPPALMLLAKRLKGFSAYLPSPLIRSTLSQGCSLLMRLGVLFHENCSPRGILHFLKSTSAGKKDLTEVEVFAFTGILHLHLLTKHLFEANIRFRANKRFLSSANKTVFTIASWENFEKV